MVTLGHRDHTGNFVQRFRNLVLEHEYVSTNSYSTALFYSLYLGRKTFVHGRFFANKLSPGKRQIGIQIETGRLLIISLRCQRPVGQTSPCNQA